MTQYFEKKNDTDFKNRHWPMTSDHEMHDL